MIAAALFAALGDELEELCGELRTDAFILVLKKNVGLAPVLR